MTARTNSSSTRTATPSMMTRAGADDLPGRQPRLLMACPDCDAVQSVPAAPPPVQVGCRVGCRVSCLRCGSVLVHDGAVGHLGGSAPALAFSLAAIPLLVAAWILPLMRLDGREGATETTLWGAVEALHAQRMPALAMVVLFTTIVVPAVRLGAVTYLSMRQWRATRSAAAGAHGAPRHPWAAHCLAERAGPWAQTEILLLGMLVAFAKLATVFRMTPGAGLGALGAFVVLDRIARGFLDGRRVSTSARGTS